MEKGGGPDANEWLGPLGGIFEHPCKVLEAEHHEVNDNLCFCLWFSCFLNHFILLFTAAGADPTMPFYFIFFLLSMTELRKKKRSHIWNFTGNSQTFAIGISIECHLWHSQHSLLTQLSPRLCLHRVSCCFLSRIILIKSPKNGNWFLFSFLKSGVWPIENSLFLPLLLLLSLLPAFLESENTAERNSPVWKIMVIAWWRCRLPFSRRCSNWTRMGEMEKCKPQG